MVKFCVVTSDHIWSFFYCVPVNASTSHLLFPLLSLCKLLHGEMHFELVMSFNLFLVTM